MTNLILENKTLKLEFNALNGALTGLTSVKTGWKILSRPSLGLSFKLMIPLPGKRNNLVYGEKQTVSSLEVGYKNDSITFIWNSVFSEFGGEHDIKIKLNISLEEHKAIYSMEIQNNSEYTVENVCCPCIGDLQHPPKEEWFKTFIYQYASVSEWSLWPTYQNLRGYYGFDYPVQANGWVAGCGAPMSPYILLRGSNQGLYVGVHSNSSELVAWSTELHPGYESSIDGRVPKDFKIGDKGVSTRFSAIHIPYILPGENRMLTPVAMEAFEGDWQKGIDIYKEWRSSWMKTPKLPSWAAEPHSWQQLHINSPEDELRMKFKDLVKVGEECAKHGIKAIQLVGWNAGGQDQGNPSHNPDPRLGTFEELKDAISKIQALGVKIILFSKFTWADRATERFRKDLIKQAIKDPYGDYYLHGGYQYQTATQLLDINTKRLIPMCFLSEEYLKICEEEFKKTVELGADGILFDECLHHGPALLCFDESHGHRYGAPVYANDRELIKRFEKLVPKDKEFLFAGEACYDWELEAYHLSYHRSESKHHLPLSRYMLPQVPLMTAVTGFDDRNMINQCLLYKYIISYEPHNFKGRLEDYPLTLEYGKAMDALRTELRDYFWYGEFRDKCGAQVVTLDNKPHHPYAVFINHKNAKGGIAIANYEDSPITVKVKLEDGILLTNYRTVDDPTWKPVKENIVLPPHSAVVAI